VNVELRQRVMEFIQGSSDITDGVLCIGVAMVVELMDTDGERHVICITSDAGGKSLPYYTVNGFAEALREEDDFDAPRFGEEDE
jgi:hypothetical protein